MPSASRTRIVRHTHCPGTNDAVPSVYRLFADSRFSSRSGFIKEQHGMKVGLIGMVAIAAALMGAVAVAPGHADAQQNSATAVNVTDAPVSGAQTGTFSGVFTVTRFTT